MTSSDAKSKDTSSKDELAVQPPAPGALTYNGYLKVKELKELQVCESNPPHHDEPLFIIIHQTYELWFKLILHEIDEAFVTMAANKVRRTTLYLRRVVQIMRLLVQQIHILETMTPQDFLGFRYDLSPASGFGSSQFREIEFSSGAKHLALMEHFRDDPAYEVLKRRYEAPSLGDAFYAMLRRRGFILPEALKGMTEDQVTEVQDARIRELLKLYTDEDNYGDLHDLAESMVDLDEQIFLWRANHVTVVERMIGFKRGTGGSEGVGYLQSTLTKRCFPDFWKLRTFLAGPESGSAQEGGSLPTGCPFHSA